jgi:hypothetical protein
MVTTSSKGEPMEREKLLSVIPMIPNIHGTFLPECMESIE